jgi:hypothetical protein
VAAQPPAAAAGAVRPFDANPTYDPGKPDLTDLWVDPLRGDDSAPGTTRARALKTVRVAMARIPHDTRTAGSGYRIMLAAGRHLAGSEGGLWLEGRKGSREHPIVFESADGPLKAVLPALAIARCSFV